MCCDIDPNDPFHCVMHYVVASTLTTIMYHCSNVIEMRNKHKDEFLKTHGVKLGFMSPFVKATCFALQNQPVVNAGNNVCNRSMGTIII